MPETRAGKLELELKVAEEDYFDHDLTLDNISQDADGIGQGEEDEKEEEVGEDKKEGDVGEDAKKRCSWLEGSSSGSKNSTNPDHKSFLAQNVIIKKNGTTKANKSDEDRIVNGYEAGEKISWTDREWGQNIFP